MVWACSTLKLASFIAFTFVCAHWLACGLYLVTSLEPGQVRRYPTPLCACSTAYPANEFMTRAYASATVKILTSVGLLQRTWLTAYNESAGDELVVKPHQIYIVALYWAVMTMCV